MWLLEDQFERLAGDRELLCLDQALVVGFADADHLGGGQRSAARGGWPVGDTLGHRLPQALERLVEGAAVGQGDHLHEMGQGIGRDRRSAQLEHLARGGLGGGEEVIGNRQAEEPFIRGGGQGGLLPGRELGQLLQSAAGQFQHLAVVFVVDRLGRICDVEPANGLRRRLLKFGLRQGR